MSDAIIIHTLSHLNTAQIRTLQARTEDDLTQFTDKVVPIIEDVKLRGDDALRDYATKFDGADMDGKAILATSQEIKQAYDKLDGKLIEALEYAADNLANVSQNTSASRSRILDADYASETTELARTQIIQQAGTAMLSQANQQAQSVLALLR